MLSRENFLSDNDIPKSIFRRLSIVQIALTETAMPCRRSGLYIKCPPILTGAHRVNIGKSI